MPCIGINSHPTWDKLTVTGPPGPQGKEGDQGEIGRKGNLGPTGAPIPHLNPLGQNDVQIMKEVSLSDNTALGKISVPEAGVTVSYLVDVLKEMGIVSKIPKKWQSFDSDITGENPDDSAGWAVSLSGDGKTLAFGAPGHNDRYGKVRVFRHKGDKWTTIGDIDGTSTENAGYSVSISEDGNTLAFGAPAHSNSGKEYIGRVRVLKYQDKQWKSIGSDIGGINARDSFGWSVSLSADGSTVAVGAPYHDESDKGQVRVFRYNDDTTSWEQLGDENDLDGVDAGDLAGHSVSLSADGSAVAIGAIDHDSDKGHVRVFKYKDDTSRWEQLGDDLDGVDAGDRAGYSVSLSVDGSTLAVGAFNHDDKKGHVRVFRYNGASWTKIGDDIDGVSPNDEAGRSVSLSADGNTVAVGAPLHDADETDNNEGQVRVFSYDIAKGWVQIGGDINGSEPSDNTGRCVSLSADGLTLAIGETAGTSSSSAGKVRMFKL